MKFHTIISLLLVLISCQSVPKNDALDEVLKQKILGKYLLDWNNTPYTSTSYLNAIRSSSSNYKSPIKYINKITGELNTKIKGTESPDKVNGLKYILALEYKKMNRIDRSTDLMAEACFHYKIDHPLHQFYRATMEFARGEYKESIHYFEKLAIYEGYTIEMVNHLTNIYSERYISSDFKEPKKAIAYGIQTIEEINRKNTNVINYYDAYLALANAFYSNKEYEKAKLVMEEAKKQAEIHPSDQVFNLCLEFKLEDTVKNRYNIKKFILKSPSSRSEFERLLDQKYPSFI